MAAGRTQRRGKGRGPGRPPASSSATIHEAALELFLERGYGAVSVDDIARRAGVSRGTVFSYCESKADALWVALDAAIARAGDALEAAQGDGAGRERGALDALVEAIVAAVEPWGRTPPVALRDARAMEAEAALRDGAPARLQPLVERAALALALERDALPESPAAAVAPVAIVAAACAALAAWALEPGRPEASVAVRTAIEPLAAASRMHNDPRA
ncbi:TetR/AcrR family transcriptional regulator [Agrococcus sp. Marseille-Q4369]|uniref:TetR/AcrR family transcriptional regulator n=1 Tax=Agrococcus sp. Marseille-Q4369 TaxID=2810513 RepID=UPI001B8AFB2F|nr:TetR/AcrR family transcriptional regulator [Agrococcus sp. Marseille-Q4369]QUW19400.1 TetR family transcriptional regulator [Agrococcus sp. Marseille-Q4369]